MQILVPFSLYRGYYEMAAEALVATYTSGQGLTLAKVRTVPQGMGAVYAIFIIEWLVLLLLAFYLVRSLLCRTGHTQLSLIHTWTDSPYRRTLECTACCT